MASMTHAVQPAGAAGSFPLVVQQHADDAAVLYSIRTRLLRASHVKLKHIGRFDERIAAHLDGLSVAGEAAWPVLNAQLSPASAGAVFAATVIALENKSTKELTRLYALAEAAPDVREGLVAAFGWVQQGQLRGIVSALLASSNPFARLMGLSACSMHRVDAGKAREAALEPDSPPELRIRALRSMGELGRSEFASACLKAIEDENPACAFWACWSTVLLGNRGVALDKLKELGLEAGPYQARALQLTCQALNQADAHLCLQALAKETSNQRELIRASGIVGDATYIAWLVRQMEEKKLARVAGEAFALITGVDLALSKLDRQDTSGEGPNDDPDDANVALEEDDSLPWPDPERVAAWWQANEARFTPGVRYFLGAPPSAGQCMVALKEGFQRQRVLAAYYRALQNPDTPLFEWRAPASRQQVQLATLV